MTQYWYLNSWIAFVFLNFKITLLKKQFNYLGLKSCLLVCTLESV